MTELIKISMYRDGGTTVWITPETKAGIKTVEDARDCKKYYLDNRLGSSTKGELFDEYPNYKNAKMLDKSQFIFLDDTVKNIKV